MLWSHWIWHTSVRPSSSPTLKLRSSLFTCLSDVVYTRYTPEFAVEIIMDRDTNNGSIDSDVSSDHEHDASTKSTNDETSSVCSNTLSDSPNETAQFQVEPQPQGDELLFCASSSSTEIRFGRNRTPWKSVPKTKPERTAPLTFSAQDLEFLTQCDLRFLLRVNHGNIS